ncbi:hypothetical protein Acr_10g0006160 [Actinidia rufa]|uniref:Uncharacterized protein n=1 Tax=Actinidia rufa TaxID=165716 RepID=A0A7J0F9A4_9ERIC|nr:hypothetical protein Acr_10g0006160 [Actinidia rufa]
MLTCITCSKQRTEDEDGGETGARGTPRTKESVKGLTAQVVKLSTWGTGQQDPDLVDPDMAHI